MSKKNKHNQKLDWSQYSATELNALQQPDDLKAFPVFGELLDYINESISKFDISALACLMATDVELYYLRKHLVQNFPYDEERLAKASGEQMQAYLMQNKAQFFILKHLDRLHKTVQQRIAELEKGELSKGGGYVN